MRDPFLEPVERARKTSRIYEIIIVIVIIIIIISVDLFNSHMTYLYGLLQVYAVRHQQIKLSKISYHHEVSTYRSIRK